ncbi:MAG: sensor domain-containing diguanylate cyclase, partial [Candidatus Omnitrophica bacterium]|nr:sensor domain-containing diguanylate cyclase [Candidatus Omnitrophota bacterium]
MTPKPKQRLSRYFVLLVSSLLIPLAGFFIYAARVELRFFVFLSLALSVNIAVLFFFYHRLKNKKKLFRIQREEYFEKANLLKVELDKESAAIAAFREKIVSYSQLKVLLEALGMCLTLEDVVHALCKETVSFFHYQDSTIILYLVDHTSGNIAILYSARNHHLVNIKLKQGDVFDRWCLKTLQALHIQDTRNDFRFDAQKADDEDRRQIRSLVSVPLMVHNKVVGILRLDSHLPGRFTPEDLRFLRTIGEAAAVAIENAQLYDKVEDLAIRDSLTGLFLRRYLMERMAEELPRHTRREKTMAFIMFDLDHFKTYNDRFGHPAGDILLKTMAEMLKSHFSEPGNLVCRYGGEEFCVLLPECGRQEAYVLANAFVELIAKRTMVRRREITIITLSA